MQRNGERNLINVIAKPTRQAQKYFSAHRHFLPSMRFPVSVQFPWPLSSLPGEGGDTHRMRAFPWVVIDD